MAHFLKSLPKLPQLWKTVPISPSGFYWCLNAGQLSDIKLQRERQTMKRAGGRNKARISSSPSASSYLLTQPVGRRAHTALWDAARLSWHLLFLRWRGEFVVPSTPLCEAQRMSSSSRAHLIGQLSERSEVLAASEAPQFTLSRHIGEYIIKCPVPC